VAGESGAHMIELAEPSESDDIACHLQQIGMGTLVCRAAGRSGTNHTNEVDAAICFNCPAGKIYREVGCDAVQPRIWVLEFLGGRRSAGVEGLFCTVRRRDTTLEYCRSCGLAQAETTKELVSVTTGLFVAQRFHGAYQDLEKARRAMRDGEFDRAITCSIACLESTMRSCHEELGETLPKSKDVVALWKSTRSLLDFDALDTSGATTRLINVLAGVVSALGGVRNALSDAHGRGTVPPSISETISELAINCSATLSTAVLRRFSQVKEQDDGRHQVDDSAAGG
jgi:hypothetical protein